MVVHDCVGTQVNGKYGAHQLDAIHNPLAAVFEIKAGQWVRTTQKGSPYASGDAVVVRGVFN